MNEIICPNCNKPFKIDDAGFASILKQVRDKQFDEELIARLDIAKSEKENAIKLAEANLKNSMLNEIASKDREILELKAKSDKDSAQSKAT